jgi:hypothetical protein
MLALAALAWQMILNHPGGWLLPEGEDAMRALLSWGWAHSPSFAPHRDWLPLYFYLNGSFRRLVGDPMAAQVALNALLSAAGLWAYVGVLDRLSPGRGPQNLALAAACALSPHFIQNSLYARADALFLCCVFAGIGLFLTWLETGRPVHQTGCVLALGAASLTRYEGWAFALCFVVLAWNRPRRWLSLLALLPAMAWGADRWHALGSPLAMFPDIALTAHTQEASLSTYNLGRLASSLLLGTPHALGGSSAALALLGMGVASGLFLAARTPGPQRAYLALAGLPTAAMAYLAMVHDYPVVAPHMVVFHMLWMAFLAEPLRRVFAPSGMPLPLAVLMAALAALPYVGAGARPPQKTAHPRPMQMVQALRGFVSRNFSPGDALVFETQSFVPQSDDPNFLSVVEAAVHPFVVVPDREDLSCRYLPGGCLRPDQESLLALPRDAREARLKDRNARLLLLQSPGLKAKLEPDWLPAGRWGPHDLLMRRGDRLGPGLKTLLRSGARAFPEETRPEEAAPARPGYPGTGRRSGSGRRRPAGPPR